MTQPSAGDSSVADVYVRSVWMAYYELQALTQENDEEGFRKSIDNAFQTLKDMGFNTVTVQVRPCADAFYRSDYFPSSRYCFGEQGCEMPYDPLAVMCEIAHAKQLKLEAWVNPYRVSQDNNIDALCDSHPAKKWYHDDTMRDSVYIGEKTIYFNPAGEGVEALIVNGVREIVKNYAVSAVHFDDYFYPTTEKEIDREAYRKYCENGGKLPLADFRRETVTHMIKAVYQAVKEENSAVQFGISPAANIENDYSVLYADVETWATEAGCCDYIVPQVYFGFCNTVLPFMQTVKRWEKLSQCPLYVGLPLYKAGKADEYAGKTEEAVNEFINNHDIIARQITYLSKCSHIGGYYVFSYGCLNDERCAEEVQNMLQAMQSSNPQQHHSTLSSG